MGDYKVGALSQFLQSSGTKLTSAADSFLTSKKPSPEKHSTQQKDKKKKKKKKLENVQSETDSGPAVKVKKSDKDNEPSTDSKSKKKRKRKKKSNSQTTVKERTSDNDNVKLTDSKIKKRKKEKEVSENGPAEKKAKQEDMDISSISNSESKKKKKKDKEVSENGPAEKKAKQEVSDIGSNSNSESKKKRKKKKKKTSVDAAESSNSNSTAGFNPPPGIVHETKETKTEKTKETKKRKLKDDDTDEEEIESKKSKQKKTRHRRDRLKKENENRTVFIGNIPISTKKRDLLKMFKDFGQIESMRLRCLPVNDPSIPKRVVAMKGDFHPSRHNCVAYICFKEEECARKALSQNGKEVDGLHIRVDMAGKIDKTDMKLSIFVGNLPYDLEEEVLRDHFDDCGKIENVRVVRDRKTCIGKGFGYVKFADKDGVSLAAKLNGSTLKKRAIRVMPCVAKVKKSKDPATHGGKKSFDKGKPGDRKKPDIDRRQKKFNNRDDRNGPHQHAGGRDNRNSPHQQHLGSKGGAFVQNKHGKISGDKPLSHIVFDDDSDGEKQQNIKHKTNNKHDQKFKKKFNKVKGKQAKKSFRPSNVRKNPFHTKLAGKESKKQKPKTNKQKS